MNEMIRADEVRLVDDKGEQVGIVPFEDALKQARDKDFDLVEVGPMSQPPVCRMMDFGKYKYEQQKRLHEQRRKQHAAEIKQLRIKTFRIDPHDIGIKLKKAREFIELGHRLLLTLMFRAREHSHADLGEQLLLEKFAEPLSDIAKVESPPRKDGRRMTMTLAPLPNLKQILKERKRKEKAEAEAAEEAESRGETESGEPADASAERE